MGDVTENAEYEDDFEKDLECLTDEEEKKNPGKKEEDVEAQIHKAAYSSQEDNEEVEESLDQLSEADVNVKMIYANEKYFPEASIEQKGHESDERESFIQECKLENEQELEEDEDMKRYVLEKIEEANKNLENQTPVDQNRERKLKFKDEMDIKAPPPKDADLARGDDVSIGLSQLHISDDTGQKHTLSEDIETQHTAPKSSLPTDPSPPSDSKQPPDSASNGAKDLGKQKTESASTATKTSTYTLTPKQKELRKQIEIRNEILRREEEDRKRELEEMRRRENEIVYKAWLQKKKVQLKEEKRIRRAKQLEELRMKDVNRDPEEAYRLWLKKKHQQYMKEKRIEFLRRQTEEVAFVPRAEECNRAFRDWLRRKKEEKQEAELAAKERGRLFKLEARRARQMRSMHYINSEAKLFCFTDHYS
ncbi:LOW QUALITY PROTEIN: coiled-coil domain-containing protein 181 [Parus major]|uniref:LOW QUALITY PROTEIN: coiled-coil domain-containing protein 181 n=1 Tax=Parus major TaxID=9157 RepID=UPI0007713523|nr:LOW QUALITY PROTEIN: coiled-coil domain-containing protein 181 [Parus major]